MTLPLPGRVKDVATQQSLDELAKHLPVRQAQFNVLDYGARGNGTTDDTAAIQAAATAAIAAGGKLYFPAPSVNYQVSSTITLQPASGTFFCLDIEGESPTDVLQNIIWAGGNNDTIFQGVNWHNSEVKGIHIGVSGTQTGVVGWDLDNPTGNSFWVQFRNCTVSFQNASNANCVGWRMGHSGAGGGGNSDHLWDSCYVFGISGNLAGSNIGWAWENQQCLLYNWVNSYTADLSKGWTASPTGGSNPGNEGGGGMTWTGCGGTSNTLDFDLQNYGSYEISGGRFETGTSFLNADFGDTAGGSIEISGVTLSDYARTGALVVCKGSIGLHISAMFAANTVGTYHAQFLTLYGTGAFQTLTVEDSQLCVAASGFLYFPTGTPTVNFRNNGRMNTDGLTVAAQLNPPIPTVASVATVTLGPEETTTISGTADVTSITASYVGRRVTLIFSGTAATSGLVDGSNLKLAGTLAYTPDDTITLVCDGTNWLEVARSVN